MSYIDDAMKIEYAGQARQADPRAREKDLAYQRLQTNAMADRPPSPSNLGGGEISQQLGEQEKMITVLAETIAALQDRLGGVIAPRPRANEKDQPPAPVSSHLGGVLQRHNEALALAVMRLQCLREDIVL